MGSYDKQYLDIVEKIMTDGYRAENRTGIDTIKVPHVSMSFDLEEEFPILTTKKMGLRLLTEEMLWIYRDMSNDVTLLQEKNVHIWDEWTKEDDTIGTAYGWVVKEYDQINKLIETLKTNPQDRRMMLNLYQLAHIEGGSLPPCAFLSMFDVTDGRLNCMLVQRSGDFPLGVPFNTTQYAILTYMLAQVTGLKPGLLTHVINNAHIYENQLEGMKEHLSRKGTDFPAPKLILNPDVKEFKDFKASDVTLVDYQHHPAIKMDVAV